MGGRHTAHEALVTIITKPVNICRGIPEISIRQETCQKAQNTRIGVFSQLRNGYRKIAQKLHMQNLHNMQNLYITMHIEGLDLVDISGYNLLVREIPVKLLES